MKLGFSPYIDQKEQGFYDFICLNRLNIKPFNTMKHLRQPCIEEQGFDSNSILRFDITKEASKCKLIILIKINNSNK